MGIVAAIRSLATSSRNLEDPNVAITGDALDLLTAGIEAASGESVTAKSVLGNPAIWRGIQLVSGSVATMPLHVHSDGGEQGTTKARQHRAYRLINRQASPETTAMIWRQTITSHALHHGNGFGYVTRDDLGRPIRLDILDPVQTTAARVGGQLVYRTVDSNGQPDLLSGADVVHIKGLSPDGLTGYSLVDVLRDHLGLGQSLMRYGSTYFRHGGKPGLVIEVPAAFAKSREKMAEFRRTFEARHYGSGNSNQPLLVAPDSNVTTLASRPDEGQFLQSRELDLKLCSLILGIPGSMMGVPDTVSYGSLESDQRAYLQHCLEYWLCQWESELESKLLTERQKASGSHYVEFDRRSHMRSDPKTTIEILRMQYESGMVSWEEMRAVQNLSTVRDESQTWLQPANLVDPFAEPPEPPEPPEPVEVIESNPEPTDEADPAADETAERSAVSGQLHAIETATLQRLATRASKAHASGKPVADSRAVMVESLPHWDAEQIDAVVSEWQQTLDDNQTIEVQP